jgi:hypothetical protein
MPHAIAIIMEENKTFKEYLKQVSLSLAGSNLKEYLLLSA